MWQYIAKVFITVVLVIAISEVGRRSSLWGAILASLPITSLLAFIWLYTGTGNPESVAKLSQSIFWLVLASLPLFLILPALLRRGITFWPALAAACIVTVVAYFGLVWVLERFNVQL
ncbi:MAG: DUF3147 family protein [Gammaproteobacteria bacterium]